MARVMNKEDEENEKVQTSTMIKRGEEPEEEREMRRLLISNGLVMVAPRNVGG